MGVLCRDGTTLTTQHEEDLLKEPKKRRNKREAQGEEQINTDADDRGTFDLEVKWDVTIKGEAAELGVRQVKFSTHNCAFIQHGVDDTGVYDIKGKLLLDGSATIELTYAKTGTRKLYKGHMENNAILGTCEEAGISSGDFILEFTTLVWVSGNSLLCLKSHEELVGFAFLEYGWGMVSGSYTGPESAVLSFFFPDGKRGSFQSSFSNGAFFGKVQLPSGTATLYFLKNSRPLD